MALEWNNEPVEHTAEELEALAAGISDMRYGAQPHPDGASTSAASAQGEGQQAKAEAADGGASDGLSFGAFDFIVGDKAESAPVAPVSTPVPSPAPAPAAAPAPAPVAPAPAPAPVVPAPQPVRPAPAPAPVPMPAAPPAEIPLPSGNGNAREAATAASASGAQPEEAAPKKSLLDRLNQPIDKDSAKAGISALIARRGKGGAWPSKTTINLYVKSDKEINPRKIAVISVIAAAAIIAFLKFGVFDQLARVTMREVELSGYQTNLVQLQAQLTDYQEVREQYEAYNVQTSSTDIDALGTLDMVDRVVRPRATVVAEQIDGNVLTLVLKDATLQTYGDLITQLSQELRVSNVSLQAADNQSADTTEDVTATLTVKLRTITEMEMIEDRGSVMGGSHSAAPSEETATSADGAGNIVSQTVDNVSTFGATPEMEVTE